jgi:coenzyme PQQ synthesis protein D (PqqD)
VETPDSALLYYCHAPTVEHFCFSNGLVLLEGKERLFAYNEAAAKLWARLRTSASIADLRDQLSKEYGLPLGRAREDAQSIVNEWLSRRLIEPCGTSALHSRAGAAASALGTTGLFSNAECEERLRHPPMRWATLLAQQAIAFSVDSPRLGALLRHQFPEADCANAEQTSAVEIRCTPEGHFLLLIDGCESFRSKQPQEVLGTLILKLIELLHPGMQWLAVIHGGAVAKQGKAYAFAAPSGSGKSTLVAYLSHIGYRYVSDDMIILSSPPELSIVPIPLALSIKPGSVNVLSEYFPHLRAARGLPSPKGELRFITPQGCTWNDSRIPVKTLIFPQYGPANRSELVALSPLDVVTRLIADNVWLGYPIVTAKAQSFLDWLHRIPGYSLQFHDLNEAGQLLDKLATA